MENDNATQMTATKPDEEDKNILKRIWDYRRTLKFEIFILFSLLPDYLAQVSTKNFPLEKACRLNYNYNEIVCAAILEKDDFGVRCDGFRVAENGTLDGSGAVWNVTELSPDFNYTVCKAEQEVQKLTANIFGIRSTIASIFPLIVVLFVGSWSDRYCKRKVCILIPFVGAILGFLVQLISSIFFHSVPMEVGMYLEVLLPAMFGGSTFFFMAIYSYLTTITPEPDRVFRFGIFYVAVNCSALIATPFGGIVYKELGYISSFLMALIIMCLTFAYGILFLEEAKAPDKPEVEKIEGMDNQGFEMSEEISDTKEVAKNTESVVEESKSKKSCLAEFFDPTLAIECFKVLLRKRPNNEQSLLSVLIIAYVLSLCPSSAEAEHWHNYTLRKLNWNGNQYSLYESYSTATGIIGTFFGTTVLSKILKLPDPIIGIMATMSIIISRPLFAFAKSSIMVYIAVTVEMFTGLSTLAIRAMASSIVEDDELGRMYSLLSISETLAGFVFPFVYGYIYSGTVETFPGAIYLLSEIFAIPNILVYIGYIVLLKLRDVPEPEMVKTTENPTDVTRL